MNVKAIYMSYWATRHAGLRSHVLHLLEETELNGLVIDIKGEDGLLYDTFTQPTISDAELEAALNRARFPEGLLAGEDYPELDLSWLKTQANAVLVAAYEEVQDLATLLAWLKAGGYYTIARIAAFRDDRLVEERPDLAIQDSRTGLPWRDDRDIAWADPYRPQVWDYNAAIAAESVRRGFDEIQYDFIRFPTGGPTQYAEYAQANTPEGRQAALNGLLSRTRAGLSDAEARLAVDFFGYTCWSGQETGIGQVIESVAPHIDVLCPMLYPSTFGTGLPGFPQYQDAIAFPYEVVNLSTERAVERLKRVSPAAIVRPWLQDFPDYRFDKRTYTPQEIQAQMRGAVDGGAEGWLLFDPRVQYTRDALEAAVPPSDGGDDMPGFHVVTDPLPHLADPDGNEFFVVGVNYEGYFDRAWRLWNDDTFDLALIEKDFRKARQIGCNTLRMFVQTALERDIRAGIFDKLDRVLDLAAYHGLVVILTLNDDHSRNLSDAAQIAAAIAEHYRDHPAVLGYDLENEPKLYHLLVAQYPDGYPAPVQSRALVEYYGEWVSRDEIAELRQQRRVPSFLDDEMAYYYANALQVFLEFDAAANQWRQQSGQTLADYIASPDSDAWQPFLEVMDGTVAAWISAQSDPVRAVAPNALITVGWNWLHFAALPANELLDFHAFHVYGERGLASFRSVLDALGSLQRRFPKAPVLVGEFGYSNATTSNPATSQPVPQSVTALYEGALLAHLKAGGFAGGLKWMLNDVTGVHNPYEASLGVFAAGDQPKVVAQVIKHYVDLWSLSKEPGNFSLHEDFIADLGYRYSLPNAVVVGGGAHQDAAIDWQAGQGTHVYLAWVDNITVKAMADGELLLSPPELVSNWTDYGSILHYLDGQGNRVRVGVFPAGERVSWSVKAGQTYVVSKGAKKPEEPPAGEIPRPGPGQHVLILPDSEAHLDAARAYITRFLPDVSFLPDEAVGRWPYVMIVGDTSGVTAEQETALREADAWVERITADTLVELQAVLDQLAAEGSPFLGVVPGEPGEPPPPPPPPPSPEPDTYLVQPGDTLWLISSKVYGSGSFWRIIFEANLDILEDPSRIRPGQVLKIPPRP